MRPILLLAAILLAAGCAGQPRSAVLLDRIRAEGTVRVGVKADSPPFGELRAGLRLGFDIDIAEAVARRLGLRAEFVTVTSADRIPRLAAGEVDMVVASMTQTRARERQVDFSIPYFEDGPACLAKAGSGIAGYLQLGGRRVGVAAGSSTAASMARVAPEAILVELPAIADLLPALDAGQVDAIASDYLILRGLAKTSGRPGAYDIPGGRIVAEPYGIALPQDQSAWRDAVNAALMAMWEDGEWARIYASWFGPGSAMPVASGFTVPTIPE